MMSVDPAQVERVLLCSGKVYYDLIGSAGGGGPRRISALIRVEIAVSLPGRRDRRVPGEVPPRAGDHCGFRKNLRNFGAWTYMRDRFSQHFPDIELRYFGRDESACGATASLTQFQGEQKQLVEGAFGAGLGAGCGFGLGVDDDSQGRIRQHEEGGEGPIGRRVDHQRHRGVLAQAQRRPGPEQGENLFELETDKAVLEIPSPDAGTLETLVEEGDGSGDRADGGCIDLGWRSGGARRSRRGEDRRPPRRRKPSRPSLPPRRRRRPPPPARARSRRPEPAHAAPPAGRKPPPPRRNPIGMERRVERVPMTAIRKRTAERLVHAQHTAHLTTFNEVDMSALSALRERKKERVEKEHGLKLSFMPFFAKAACLALKAFPTVNAQVDGDAILYKHYVNLGIAVASEAADRGAPGRRPQEHPRPPARHRRARQDGAGDGKLTMEELTGGSFTITNGGVFGSLISTPIINFPQVAILGLHKTQDRPMAVNGQIVIRPMMYVALSYDHRVIDGREASGFLLTVKDYIEEPDKLLLEIIKFMGGSPSSEASGYSKNEIINN